MIIVTTEIATGRRIDKENGF